MTAVSDCPDLTSAHGLNEYLAAVRDGGYRACPGSVGDILVQAHPSTDRWTAERSLARFVRLAYRREGLWWPMILAADPDTLGLDEETTVLLTWRQWVAGDNPWRRHGSR